jgi:hypothetical protein
MTVAKRTSARHTLDFRAVGCIDYSSCSNMAGFAWRSQAYLRMISFLISNILQERCACQAFELFIGLVGTCGGSMLCQYVTNCNEIFFAKMPQFFIQKKLRRETKPVCLRLWI